MPQYPRQITQRFPQAQADHAARLRKLESRTAAIDSGWPLAALPAVIDPSYTTGDPHCFINGSATLTGPYQHLASYTPVASQAVLVIPVGVTQTYVVLGALA